MRIVWLNEDHRDEDLRRHDFEDAYFYRCDFTGAVFGDLVNAQFVECLMEGADLRASDTVGAHFIDCINLDDVLWSDPFPQHSIEAVSAVLLRAARTSTGNSKTIYETSAQVVMDTAGHCAWEEILETLFDQFGKKEIMEHGLAAFGEYPMLLRMIGESEKNV